MTCNVQEEYEKAIRAASFRVYSLLYVTGNKKLYLEGGGYDFNCASTTN